MKTVRPLYSVYEVTPKYRKHGKLIKHYLTKKSAEKCMGKSIFRFIRIGKHIMG